MSNINPAHYDGDKIMQAIEHANLNFGRGSIVKYVARAGRKDDELTDLEKARWYLDREIARLRHD